jgi:hypothetical protein
MTIEGSVERFTERNQHFDCLTNLLTSLQSLKNVIMIH